jgi:hypothetical protein
VEVKQTSHLLDVCRFRFFLWQFDGLTLFSVVQTGERTAARGTNSAPNIKRLCNGEYWPEQLCTKPAVLKMKESGKSSRNHRTVRGRTETCRHQQFICQTNMHLIMWIENAFKFYGKLIHFYKERISFLFYCEDGKRGAVSWINQSNQYDVPFVKSALNFTILAQKLLSKKLLLLITIFIIITLHFVVW